VLAIGGQVRCVEGAFDGFKVTTYVDWLFAQQVLEARRRGRL
jgi:2-C-methyl-D-erythritol 4-phosphate cytidylyltransferase